jgi:two-component system chemotaxis response regulator CheY
MTEKPSPTNTPTNIADLGVLIADPSPHMSALVATMLRVLKVRDIREVTDTAATMAELKRRAFDVLVLDDSLKGIGSIEFTRRLRANQECQNRLVPIIMMSGLPDTARIRQARDAGVTEFLRKPFSAQHLEARLKTILSAPREFIAVQSYAGPDRRRRRDTHAGKERRTRGAGNAA